jgi:uncharacterized protein (TIGR02611 family)
MRKLIVGVIGSLLLILGTILLFIPGPGLLLIALGVGMLSLEFDWAKKLLVKARQWFAKPKDADREKWAK